MSRPYKGAREQITLRLPVSLMRAARQQAHHDGIPLNEWVGQLVAEEMAKHAPDAPLRLLGGQYHPGDDAYG
jgi:predicted HicB family RNase H-like nuclease